MRRPGERAPRFLVPRPAESPDRTGETDLAEAQALLAWTQAHFGVDQVAVAGIGDPLRSDTADSLASRVTVRKNFTVSRRMQKARPVKNSRSACGILKNEATMSATHIPHGHS